MVWLGIVVGIVTGLVLTTLAVRRLGPARRPIDDVDPFVVVGIAIAGAGVALALVTPAMWALVVAGLLATAVGAGRTRRLGR